MQFKGCVFVFIKQEMIRSLEFVVSLQFTSEPRLDVIWKDPPPACQGRKANLTLTPTRNHAHNKFEDHFSPEVALKDEFSLFWQDF